MSKIADKVGVKKPAAPDTWDAVVSAKRRFYEMLSVSF